MNRRLIALAAAVSVSLAGAASPAQTLFDSVSQLLNTRYGGLSSVNRADLITQYQQKLTEACAGEGEACAYNTAYPILEQEIAALGDHHSSFRRPESFAEFKTQASGGSKLQYGVSLRDLTGGDQVVAEVVPGSSAFAAGLKRGDRLVGIDGQKYTYDLLRASRAKGAPIKLDVRRGDQAFSVSLLASVSSTRNLPRAEYLGDVAVIRIPTFNTGGGVAQGVHDLVREAQARGARGIVVDLRDNPGGDLRECDMSVSAFVPSFTRVAKTARGDTPTTVERGAYREGFGTYQAVRDPALWEGPVAVLVNKGSASCSEFFARELQYAKRGVIIGEATAGVGNTATQMFPLPGDSAVQLTTVHYVKPDGLAYGERVTPDQDGSDDFELLARGQDVLLQKGLDVIHTSLASVGAGS